MKTLNLILMVMLVSFGAVNLSVSKSELETKESLSAESKMDIMNVPEDITGDGVADIDDLAICIYDSSQFCTCPGYPTCTTYCTGDLNQDGFTDLTDIIQEFNYICSHLQ